METTATLIRGVIEGFYGVHYTHPERLGLIRFAGEHGFNRYLYAPKNDRQHRTRWSEPYPARMMDRFGEAVRVGQASGIDFCYAISPGASIVYSSAEDFQRMTDKLCDFYQQGVRNFSLLLDDIDPNFSNDSDRERYQDYVEAQADLCNRLFVWLQGIDPACTLSMCPTDYWGSPPLSPALVRLGQLLHPQIDIFYTGPQICSPQVTQDAILAFIAAAGRTPLVWDNYPVNDLSMQPELHTGPLLGRDPALPELLQGLYFNLMLQPEASKIALLTIAEYLNQPRTYQPDTAWANAIQLVAGDESAPFLRLFADNTQYSFLCEAEARTLSDLVKVAILALEMGERPPNSPALAELRSYLEGLDETCYHLRYRLENLALRQDLLPWIEKMDHWQDMARRALNVLERQAANQPFEQDLYFLKEFMAAAQRHPKRVMGNILLPLAQFALDVVVLEKQVV